MYILQHVLAQLPEPPSEESITSAIRRLEVLGALDEHDVRYRDWVL